MNTLKRKLNKKYFDIIFASLMALSMSFLMSGIITFINIGLVDDFFDRWLFTAYPSAFIINLPIALFVVPFIRKIALKFVEN